MKTNTLIWLLFFALIFCIPGLEKLYAAGNDTGQASAFRVLTTPGLQSMSGTWVKEFSRQHPDQKIDLVSAGSHAISLSVNDGDIAIVTGAEAARIVPEPAWEVIVGRDVLVPVINPSNPFAGEIGKKGVSPSALAASLEKQGALTWGTLLGIINSQPVHYYIPADKASKALLASFLEADLSGPGLVTELPGGEIVRAVSADPLAIGFCSMTDILAPGGKSLTGNLQLLPIDRNGNGKLDYAEQIYDNPRELARGIWIGKYPQALTSDVLLVSRAQPSGEPGAGFISWVLTDGQQYLAQNGFMDLVINERQSQLDKLAPVNIASAEAEKRVSYQKYFLWGIGGLIVLIFLLDLTVRIMRRRRAAVSETPVAGPEGFGIPGLKAPGGLYFDKTHTWTFLEHDGTVRTGIDDFLSHVTGPVTRIEMKQPGERITKGDRFITLIQNGKKLVLYSPVSGIVKANNRFLEAHPYLLHSSPLSEGWIYQVEPSNWLRETQFFFMTDKYRSWLGQEFTRLKDFLASAFRGDDAQLAHVVLQDGGEIRESLLAELGPEMWEEFQEKFLDPAR